MSRCHESAAVLAILAQIQWNLFGFTAVPQLVKRHDKTTADPISRNLVSTSTSLQVEEVHLTFQIPPMFQWLLVLHALVWKTLSWGVTTNKIASYPFPPCPRWARGNWVQRFRWQIPSSFKPTDGAALHRLTRQSSYSRRQSSQSFTVIPNEVFWIYQGMFFIIFVCWL